MTKKISATQAKNNFGGLLDDVAALGRVDIVKHGRVVATVLSPAQLREISADSPFPTERTGRNHMIPSALARSAHVSPATVDFDEDTD
jgi:prevent-host-death family protein